MYMCYEYTTQVLPIRVWVDLGVIVLKRWLPGVAEMQFYERMQLHCQDNLLGGSNAVGVF